jgi:hypothetical protein
VNVTKDWKSDHVDDHHEPVMVMAFRHVREGEKRIARQAAIVAKWDRNHRRKAATLGRKVLETMHSSLNLMKRHLRTIEGRPKS